MNTSGDRFKALLKEVNLKPTEFAKFCNAKPQHVNNWYKRGVPLWRMDEFARLLSVNSKWLYNGEGPKYPTKFATTETIGVYNDNLQFTDVEIPCYKEASTQADSNTIVITGHCVRLPKHYLESLEVDPDKAVCAPMIGKNMAEKIQDGSTIAIDRGLTQVVDGEIYVLQHQGRLRANYLYQLPAGALRLRSHNNPEYPDEIFSAEQIKAQNIQILGWVFWWSTLNKRRPPVPTK